MQLGGYFLVVDFTLELILKALHFVFSKSFDMNMQRTYRGQVFMLDG